MLTIRIVTDFEEGRRLWQKLMPRELVSDLWEFRFCFHRHYNRPLRFIVAEENGATVGFLPLSWVEEKNNFAYFPGETWQGKTWLEQNRVICRDECVLAALMEACPSQYHLRYLLPQAGVTGISHIVDEIGYLFNPPEFGYDMTNYFQLFSHKTYKKIMRDIGKIRESGMAYRYDDVADFDAMVKLNTDRFEHNSYFYDTRFRESFRDVMNLCRDNGWMRLTTILVGGNIAAVDLGCVYNNVYTLLGGGTSADFPGIAKLINLHHMEYACQRRFDRADFLCGDFSWKNLFHLSPRPLFLMTDMAAMMPQYKNADESDNISHAAG